jgi:hypothetical protein
MEEMQITSELTWIEVQFMKKAVDEVEKCRTTLKWTYAMAYYLEKGNQKELFEDNQRFVSSTSTMSYSNGFSGVVTWKKQLRTYRSYWSPPLNRITSLFCVKE